MLSLLATGAMGCGSAGDTIGIERKVELPGVPESRGDGGVASMPEDPLQILCAASSCPPGFGTCRQSQEGKSADLCGTNFASDRENCGGCGIACLNLVNAAGDVSPPLWAESNCLQGRCSVVCPSPEHQDCNHIEDDGCETPTEFNDQNCGTCGNECPAGASCVNGACGCPSGFTACENSDGSRFCVDANLDPDHCGSCANACAYTQVCEARTCTCPPGFDLCGTGNAALCVDRMNDDENCGVCGFACPTSSTWTTPPHMHFGCVGGSCDGSAPARTAPSASGPVTTLAPPPEPPRTNLKCDGNYADCKNGLADGCETDLTEPNNAHCGACGNACTAGNDCIAYYDDNFDRVLRCGCSQGTYCDDDGFGECRDLNSDIDNCGACKNACPQFDTSGSAFQTGKATCKGGICGYACIDGWDDCDGLNENGCEANVRTSGDHCGRCGNPCLPGQPCVDGVCLMVPCPQEVPR